MNYNYNKPYDKKNYPNSYRVKSPVKTFRDLYVYQVTIALANEISKMDFIKSSEDILELKSLAEKIPKLIAEGYGDRFDDKELGKNKLTESITLVSNIITKLDILREKFSEDKETKETLDKLLLKYVTQKRKILNLRNAWQRVYKNKDNYEKEKFSSRKAY
ncbi:hypothetical protein L6274_05795 [Candidatus Parcubacteria bacterium]|nr:hypothetical protein [Patescibacteria group bacterium]MCG2700530.1 hypothetical protein [Candidatus Parcubacteria bacterium]